MKRKLSLLFCLVMISTRLLAQADSLKAPYEKVPIFPPVKLLLPDKTSFTKKDLPAKKPVMLMVFNPECEHCRHETEEMLKHFDLFENTTIVMATMMPFDSMMSFRARYKLADHSNIIVGQDTEYFLAPFYQMSSLPFLAFYDRRGKLISAFNGTLAIEKAAAELKKPGRDK